MKIRKFKKQMTTMALALMVVMTAIGTKEVYAYLTRLKPDSFYNAIGDWYGAIKPYNGNYNCLAYVVDAGFVKGDYSTYYWEWPWYGVEPNIGTVDNYMASKGYGISGPGMRVDAIAYGSTREVGHFSKTSGEDSTAKWGQAEVMASPGWNPYANYGGSYGYSVGRYYKK